MAPFLVTDYQLTIIHCKFLVQTSSLDLSKAINLAFKFRILPVMFEHSDSQTFTKISPQKLL